MKMEYRWSSSSVYVASMVRQLAAICRGTQKRAICMVGQQRWLVRPVLLVAQMLRPPGALYLLLAQKEGLITAFVSDSMATNNK